MNSSLYGEGRYPFWIQFIGGALSNENYLKTNDGTSLAASVWDSMTAYARWLYIKEIRQRKCKTRDLTMELQK